MSGARHSSRRRNAATRFALLAVVGGMVGLSFAAVPLYRLFCQVTGYGGTTQEAEAAPDTVGERHITVRFDADVASDLPWRFRPEQHQVSVQVGEQALALFFAENLSKAPIDGRAVFNVTPLKAGQYFDKIACFCFDDQHLDPGQKAELPVSFFVDPDIVKDHNLDDVDTITLSYTFYRVSSGATGARAEAEGGNSNIDQGIKR